MQFDKPRTVAEMETFVDLLHAACNDMRVHATLEKLLTMPDERRRALVHVWVTDMLIAGAPPEFIKAVGCLMDDEIAEKSYEAIFNCRRPLKNTMSIDFGVIARVLRTHWRWLALLGSILVLDQAVKHAVVAFLPYGSAYAITSFFNLVCVVNPGTVLSILADAGGWQRYALATLGIGVSCVLVWLIWRGVGSRLETVAYSLIIGGVLGNVTDRIARGAVVDYLDLHWQGWHWPAFSLADTAIVFGILALVIASFAVRDQVSGAP